MRWSIFSGAFFFLRFKLYVRQDFGKTLILTDDIAHNASIAAVVRMIYKGKSAEFLFEFSQGFHFSKITHFSLLSFVLF